MKTLEQHIEITSNISGGKPRIAGHLLRILDQGYLGIDLGWELQYSTKASRAFFLGKGRSHDDKST